MRLPALRGYANVQALRTFADAGRLRAALEAGARVTVMGGGLIGLELASSRAGAGRPSPWSRRRRGCCRGWATRSAPTLTALHREDGARVHLGNGVAGVRGDDAVSELVLADGTRIATDHVVEAVGVRPATAWFAGAELDEHVFSAGDVTGSGHWDAAARQGAGVARALLGLPPAPPAPTSFWSDQLGLRLQCVGNRRRRPRGAHHRRGGPRLQGRLPPRGPRQRRAAGRPLRRRPARRPPAPDHARPARKERSMTLIPEIDTFACVAHGDCAVVAPEAFRVDDIAVADRQRPEDRLREAARACPAGAIVLIDDATGEEVDPGWLAAPQQAPDAGDPAADHEAGHGRADHDVLLVRRHWERQSVTTATSWRSFSTAMPSSAPRVASMSRRISSGLRPGHQRRISGTAVPGRWLPETVSRISWASSIAIAGVGGVASDEAEREQAADRAEPGTAGASR